MGRYGGYAEICGDMRRYGEYAEICGDMRRYAEIWGTDHLPEIGPAGLPFLDQPPPIHEGRETRTANDLQAEKRMLIFHLNY
jgi:hypothetical protein